MILALFWWVALLRFLLVCLLPPAPSLWVTVTSKQCVQCTEGRNDTSASSTVVWWTWNQLVLWTLVTTPQLRACWELWVYSTAFLSPCLWLNTAKVLMAFLHPTLPARAVAEAAEASTWLCLAAFAYLAELTALHFDSHLWIEEAKICTRSVSVISASRAAEVDGNCQDPLNVCSMNTRQPCRKVNLHHWLYKSLTCMNVFYSKMDNNWLFTVSQQLRSQPP